MGNFYVNQTVKCEDPAPLTVFLADYQAFLSPVDHATVVIYERRSDLQDAAWASAFADELSRIAGGTVLNVLNHDDDILHYSLHKAGKLINQYNSTPDYFDESAAAKPGGGDAALLCSVFGSGDAATVGAILEREYLFAIDRHRELATALRISAYGVGFGWRYLSKGERPNDVKSTDFLEFKGTGAYKGFSFPY